MNKESSIAEELSNSAELDITEEQVSRYLKQNLEFFLNHGELLSKIRLPHHSGKAISLIEKQVNLLREQELEATKKLKDLLENARNNDSIFNATKTLILALLNSDTIEEIRNSVQEQLIGLNSVDACEIIFLDHPNIDTSTNIRIEELKFLEFTSLILDRLFKIMF